MENRKFVPLHRKLGIAIAIGLFLTIASIITYGTYVTQKEAVSSGTGFGNGKRFLFKITNCCGRSNGYFTVCC